MKKTNIFILTGFLIVFFIIFIILFVPRKSVLETSDQSETTSFSLMAQWTGTNGEVIKSIFLDDTNLYAAAGFDGLMIFDSTNLNLIGSFSTNFPFQDVIIKNISSNKYAVVLLGNYRDIGGLMILDITDPTNIFVTNLYIRNDVSGYMFASFPSGYDNKTYQAADIYTADQKKGLQEYMIDWSNFTITAGKSVAIKTNAAVNLMIDQPFAYLAARDNGLFILDLINSKVLSQIKTSISYVNGFAIKNNSLVVADKMNGILFYKIEKPNKPILIENYDTPGDANDVLLDGDEFYIADGINGVLKIKHSGPENFIMEKQFNDNSMAYKLIFSKETGLLYVVCGKDGIRIIK